MPHSPWRRPGLRLISLRKKNIIFFEELNSAPEKPPPHSPHFAGRICRRPGIIRGGRSGQRILRNRFGGKPEALRVWHSVRAFFLAPKTLGLLLSSQWTLPGQPVFVSNLRQPSGAASADSAGLGDFSKLQGAGKRDTKSSLS